MLTYIRSYIHLFKKKKKKKEQRIEHDFTPVGAPAVSSDPVVHAVLRAPAVQLDGMIGGACAAGVVHVDSAGVSLDAVGVDVRTHRATHEDLRHDIFVASHGTILTDSHLGVVLHSSWRKTRTSVNRLFMGGVGC